MVSLSLHQELYVENLPAKVILHRTINFIYRGNTQYEMILPIKQLKDRYHLNEYEELWNQFTRRFLDDLEMIQNFLNITICIVETWG